MFSNARNLLLSYAIFWFSWTQRKSRMNVGKDHNRLEYIEFVEGQQKQGKEDCPKSLEIFCIRNRFYVYEILCIRNRSWKMLSCRFLASTCLVNQNHCKCPRITLGINLNLFGHENLCMLAVLLAITRYKHGDKKQ